MSTYNGERFLGEQLRSIYAQEGVDVALTVRDDGSTDSTISILDAEQRAGRLRWYADGENLGPARSFLRLLRDAGDADLYAFSDQDDVWLTDKLRAAARAIGGEQEPALYLCQTRLVDANLSELRQVTVRPLLTYGEALAYQFAGGCTMVMNAALRRVVNSYTPSYVRMHDVWVYGVALAVGARVVFDPQAHILYRQHGGNAVGQTGSALRQWRDRLARICRGERIRLRTAQELLRGYAAMMPAENRRLTERVVGYRRHLCHRLALAMGGQLATAHRTTTVTSRLALLTDQF